MKLAIVGDSHADAQNDLSDHDAVMRWVVTDAEEQGCTALVHTGDIFERKSTSEERASVAAWVQASAERMDTVLIAGNHDDPRDVELLGQLEHPDTFVLKAFTQPGMVLLEPGEQPPVLLLCLPWPSKGRLVTSSQSRQEAANTAQTALRNLLQNWGDFQLTPPREVHRVFAGHCMVRGSRVGDSQPALVGADFELGLEDLALAQCDFYALGHIHLGQTWDVPHLREGLGGRVMYPGSPRHCDFGEPDRKRYLIYDTETGEVTERFTPTRKMALLEGSYSDGTLLVVNPPDGAEGAKVRLRYTTSQEDSATARALAEQERDRLLESGAHSVKLDPVVEVTTRSRAPEVAEQKTVAGKLAAHWNASETPPPDADRVQMLQMLQELEQDQ